MFNVYCLLLEGRWAMSGGRWGERVRRCIGYDGMPEAWDASTDAINSTQAERSVVDEGGHTLQTSRRDAILRNQYKDMWINMLNADADNL